MTEGDKNYLVRDYMRPVPAVILQSATVGDAVEAMLKNRTNGLVVVDDARKVRGILSSWDVVKHVVPTYLGDDKRLARFASGDLFPLRIKEVAHHPVARLMTKTVQTIQPHHSLMQAATLLSEFRIRQLPVVDKSGMLVGYINRSDIKRAIGEVLDIKEA